MVASDDPASGRQSLVPALSDRQAISIKGKVGLYVPNARIDRNSLIRYPAELSRFALHNLDEKMSMRCMLTIVSVFLISTCCLAQDGNGPQPNQSIDLADVLTQLDKLEQRVQDLESDGSVKRQADGQQTQTTQPSGTAVDRDLQEPVKSPALRPAQMRSIYWFPPVVGWSANRGQQPNPSPPPRGEVPDNWQQINYFGRWYYLVPIEESNVAPAENMP